MTRLFPMLLASVAVMGFTARLAYAEGNCPPGQYPVGGGGVQGCAPIPQAAPPPPTPTGEWITTWGAIVNSPTTFATGVATGKFKKSDALAEARSFCESKGARDCTEEYTYKNQCMAVADPPAPSQWHAQYARANTMERAVEIAMNSCTEAGAPTCKITYADCTKPVFRKF